MLRDVEDYASQTITVQVHFLIIGDLADLAVFFMDYMLVVHFHEGSSAPNQWHLVVRSEGGN